MRKNVLVLVVGVVALVLASPSSSRSTAEELSVSIAAPATVVVGDDVTVTATVKNTGTVDANVQSFTMTLTDPGLTSWRVSPSNCGGTGTISCSVGILPVGASFTVTVVATTSQTGIFNVLASAVTGTPVSASTSGGYFVTPPPTNIAMSESITPSALPPGGSGSMGFTVTNSGSDRASFWVTLDLSPGAWSLGTATQTSGPAFSCSGSPYHVECSIGTFAGGGTSASFSVPFTIGSAAVPGTILNSRVGAFLNMPSGGGLAGDARSIQVAAPTPGGGGVTTAQHALAVTLTGTGAGTVTSAPAGIACPATCTQSFAEGTVVTLTPVAAAGSSFSSWSGACTGSGACTVTLTADTSVTASFDAATTPTGSPPPAGYCLVPRVIGLTLAAARKRLVSAHCRLGTVRGVRSARVPKGRVIAEHPGMGTPLAPGARVAVDISRGRR